MSKTFRELLNSDELIVAPGAYDAIGANLVEQAGFPAVHMSGAGVAASRGYPDLGLLTLGEMADAAGAMARSVSVPVLADADTGFGNELNVTRTVHEYELRGVAGLHIEDQVSPKRCGHLAGKQVIDRDEFTSKIAAAVEARSSDDFLVVARTDAVATHGLDEAIARMVAAIDVGADIAFIEALTTTEQLEEIPRRLNAPLLINVVPGRGAPIDSMAQLAALGYRMAICPALILGASVRAADQALANLVSTGIAVNDSDVDVTELFSRFGGAEWTALRDRLDAEGN